MLDEDMVIGIALNIVAIQPELTVKALKLLDAFCWSSSDGHDSVLLGLQTLKEEEGYPNRFYTLVNVLEKCENTEARFQIMSFINTIIESPLEEELRNSLR